MRRSVRTAGAVAAAAVLVVAAAAPAVAAPAPAASRFTSGGVAQIPLSFHVRNVNRSKVACAANGHRYTVRGHLVAPAGAVSGGRARAVTLYLHGLSFGEFFWRYQGAKGYNYAANQAAHGNASVVIDRVGYDSSGKPNGNEICVGSRADMAHQMVQDLRSGRYHLDGQKAPRYKKIVLAGHSFGSQIAQVEAYSFGDINGLIVMAYSDRVQSARLKSNAAYTAKVCSAGGERVNGDGPTGYAPFGPPSGAGASLFHSATPRIRYAVSQLLTIDPCGDDASFAPAVKVDLANLHRVHVPVLIVTGAADALFPPPAGPNQARLFTGSTSVSQVTLPGAAHALTFERAHNKLVSVVSGWLHKHIH